MIEAIPLILMDSHLYDYGEPSRAVRQAETRYRIDEVRAVRGVATVVWHQRVLDSDYGWGAGFHELLEMLAEV